MRNSIHFLFDYRIVEMAKEASLVLMLSLAMFVTGFSHDGLRPKRETSTNVDCTKPPNRRLARQCCRFPNEKIWGDLRISVNKCVGQRKLIQKSVEPEKDMIMKMTESAQMAETPKPEVTTAEPTDPTNHGKRRKPLSERVNEKLQSFFKAIKNTVNVLRQTIVLVTDFMRRRPKDQCFIECIFEDQGFLWDKKIVKEALIARLNLTLGKYEAWRKVGVQAAETCYQKELSGISPNSTCVSGSEEIFKCVFKQIFFNCPVWPRNNNYCTTLKEFYEKCPDGPPQEIEENQPGSTEASVTPEISETSEVSSPPESPKPEDPAVPENVTEEASPTTDRYTEG